MRKVRGEGRREEKEDEIKASLSHQCVSMN